MKRLSKLFAVLAVSGIALGIMPAHAATTGTIAAPSPIGGTTNSVNNGTTSQDPTTYCVPTTAGCQKTPLARAARCAYLADGGAASQGAVGYVVPVSSSATSFTLNSVPANSADFDVTFYLDLGSCANTAVNRAGVVIPGAPAPYAATTQSVYGNFGNGGESGSIPTGTDAVTGALLHTKFAIVTLFGSTNATFSFSAS